MKLYYYFLFRIYRFYTDKMKENQMPLIYTSAVSAVVTGFNIFTLFALLDFMEAIELSSTKYLILVPAGLIWVLTHFILVRRKRFLDYGFKKDTKGGSGVVVYILLTAIVFILIANLNRNKIANQSLDNSAKTKLIQNKKPSLEGKIKKWFKENF